MSTIHKKIGKPYLLLSLLKLVFVEVDNPTFLQAQPTPASQLNFWIDPLAPNYGKIWEITRMLDVIYMSHCDFSSNKGPLLAALCFCHHLLILSIFSLA